MASNFDFLKNIDKELFSLIVDSEKLFRDEYFNQCAVQLRIFAEKTAKKVLGEVQKEMTFDDVVNCLKDKIETQEQKEFVEDLFFIKRAGNKCAHGEDIAPTEVLEAIKRAFEIAISYSYSKKRDEKIRKLQFDETLLITQKPLKENKLADEYVRLASEQKAELLNLKQGEFNSNVEKIIDGRKDESFVNNVVRYKKTNKRKKELTPSQKRVKEKIKKARKTVKQKVNKIEEPKKIQKKNKKNKKQKNNFLKHLIFIVFVTISLFFLTKMMFFY